MYNLHLWLDFSLDVVKHINKHSYKIYMYKQYGKHSIIGLVFVWHNVLSTIASMLLIFLELILVFGMIQFQFKQISEKTW